MKIKTVLAAAVIASTSTMSFAGNTFEAVDEAFIPVLEETTAASSSSGGNYILPAILGLLILGAVSSSGGS